MDDTLVATFAVIDWAKNKLTIAPATVALTATRQRAGPSAVAQASPVFAFLKKHRASKVYMAVSYMMKS